MKARQVKPVFWTDSAVSQWPDELRLFYIGTWMLADDEGVMRSEPSEIARQLYPDMASRARTQKAERLLAKLAGAGKVVPLECGRHAAVPTVQFYPQGGNKSYHIAREHRDRCVRGG
jgi:hypothetical protein